MTSARIHAPVDEIATPSILHRRRAQGWMRAQVLQLIRSSGTPIRAGSIVHELSSREEGIHQSGVSRALAELVQAGLVDRIETLAGYVPRRSPAVAAVCTRCGSLEAVLATDLSERLAGLAREAGWTPDRIVMETLGSCRSCLAGQPRPATPPGAKAAARRGPRR